MISMVILYPKSDDSTFDMDYYTTSHMPLLAESLADACKGWGVSGPSDKYHAVGWAMVESQDALNATLAEHGAKIIGDVANYTTVQPEIIVGDVVV